MDRVDHGRRQFLAAAGAVGTAALAGCGGDGNGNDATPTASPTPTATTPNAEAKQRYESAIAVLTDLKATLAEWAASSYESDAVATLQGKLETAHSDLEAAESAADPAADLVGEIRQATLVANFQSLILSYYEAVNAFFQLLSEAQTLGDDENHERAAQTYAEAHGILDDARNVIEDMGTLLEDMDADPLAAQDLAYDGDPLDHLDLSDRRAIDGAEQNARGNEHIHRAFVQLETGQGHYESEAFGEARAAWETGLQRARSSKAAFEAALDNEFIPENLRTDSSAKLAATETVVDAFEKFVAGATAAEEGNLQTANTHVQEAFELLGQL